MTKSISIFFSFLFFFFSFLRRSMDVREDDSKRDTQDFVNKGKYRKCISSVQKANENSIEFSLSTQTRRVIKSSWTKVATLELDNPHLSTVHLEPCSKSLKGAVGFIPALQVILPPPPHLFYTLPRWGAQCSQASWIAGPSCKGDFTIS